MKDFLEKLKKFYEEVKVEMTKVSWPSRQEIINSTVVVIVATVAIAAYVGVIDRILVEIIKRVVGA